jgi:hypothetical protein
MRAKKAGLPVAELKGIPAHVTPTNGKVDPVTV